MDLLIVAATALELQPTIAHLKSRWIENDDGSHTLGDLTVRVVITGPGLMRMAMALSNVLTTTQPKLCINAGIGGAFPGKFELGDVVHVTREICADLGAEDAQGHFLSLSEMGLEEDLNTQLLTNASAGQFTFLPTALGISVNTTSGTSRRIAQMIERYDPDVESMEGAAFFYTCLKYGVEFLQLRAISNIVEPRDRSKWEIDKAIEYLNRQVLQILSLLRG